jgi:hypothetical protein
MSFDRADLVSDAEVAEGGTGTFQVGILLGEAIAEQVLSPAGTIKCRPGNSAHAGRPKKVSRLDAG